MAIDKLFVGRIWNAISWLLLCSLCLTRLEANEKERLWQAANAQFHSAGTPEQYAMAAASMETLVALGVRNGYLFYNLGNAYLKANRLGEAIASYRRAELYVPGYADLHENLRYARSLRQAIFAVPDTSLAIRYVFFWHTWPWRTRAYSLLVCYSLLWLALLMRLKIATVPLALLLACALLPTLALTGSLAYDHWLSVSRPEAVLIGDDSVVRKGDGDSYEMVYTGQKSMAGVEVRILESQGDWYKVELPDHLYGWIRKNRVVHIA